MEPKPIGRDPAQRAGRSLFNEPMGGHLFVLRGDLTKLHCSAVLIPSDSKWNVVWEHWFRLLPRQLFDLVPPYGARLNVDPGDVRFADAVTDGDRWVRLVVTADDDRFAFTDDREYANPEETARWVADGVVDAIADWLTAELPMPTGRVKPLIGLPLVGTGAGGFGAKRGVLIDTLIPLLQKAAHDRDVDIALVLIDERDHAAVQAVRSAADWDGLAEERPELVDRLRIADDLGDKAARRELSLFLGSGVSVPLGLPDWRKLLEIARDEKIEDFDPEKAPDIAQDIEDKLSREALTDAIEENLKVSGVAPTHMLLAALSVDQSVTTNYDTAYEDALTSTLGDGKYSVLTGQLALQPHPWLLKYHGCVNRPETIIITRDDYNRLRRDFGALQSIVESLMLTSHLMFVGFSMADADFLDAAKRVNTVREQADRQESHDVATVLALHPQAVMEQAHFKVVSMLGDPNDKSAARLMEIFLDRISWKATTSGPASSSYLLDPNYQDLFATDSPTAELRVLLGILARRFSTNDPIYRARGWDKVAHMLQQLGAREQHY
jgi:hypothetical protein